MNYEMMIEMEKIGKEKGEEITFFAFYIQL